MAVDRVSELSEIQKSCLRLVAANRTSKEIALDVGLSHMTVDQYLSRATAMLGASNRRDAARILIESEGPAQFKQFEFKPEPVAEPPVSAISEVSAADRMVPRHRTRTQRMMSQMAQQIGGTRHDFNLAEILTAILRMALITSAGIAAMIAAVYWLNLLFR